MYEKNKKLDVVEEPIISEIPIQVPKEEEKKQEFNILDQIHNSINSSEPPKLGSTDDQELQNRLNLINQSLQKLDIKNLENKDLLFNSLS